jgi:hypothetical protein
MPPTVEYVAAYATAATALGTLGLAVATFRLAGKTKDLAEAGERELELMRKQADSLERQSNATEQALNAGVAPLLLSVPPNTLRAIATPPTLDPSTGRIGIGTAERDVSHVHSRCDDESVALTIPIRNVGAGIARVDLAVINYAHDEAKTLIGEPPAVVAPGDIKRVVFEGDAGYAQDPLRALLMSQRDLVVELSYADISGRQGVATVLFLRYADVTHSYSYRVIEELPAVECRLTKDPDAPSGWGELLSI